MRFFLYILSLTICIASCVTQQRCNDKFPPQIIVKDSTILKDTTYYKDTAIQVPGTTITNTITVKDTTTLVDTTIKQGKTQLHLQVKKGKVTATCNQDSLLLVIHNLQHQITSKENYHTATTIKTVTVVKYKLSKWFWWLLVALIISAGWNFRKLILLTLQTLLK